EAAAHAGVPIHEGADQREAAQARVELARDRIDAVAVGAQRGGDEVERVKAATDDPAWSDRAADGEVAQVRDATIAGLKLAPGELIRLEALVEHAEARRDAQIEAVVHPRA